MLFESLDATEETDTEHTTAQVTYHVICKA